MKKDVIYVDIEDDITSIIEKVKSAETKIVALVPPKRIGVLQSVVNLKLLQRAAATANKRVVLITSNQALTALAAGVAIPVAKNLQSKPEIPVVPQSASDDEDIIRGDELPIGELASIAPVASAQPLADKTPASASEAPAVAASTAPAVAAAQKTAPNAPKKPLIKVPNFDSFRKKIFILGGLGVLLIGFFVWALAFAPRATVNITAKTTPYDVKKALTLGVGKQLAADDGVAPLILKEIQKTNTVDFTPTGKKEVGEAAKGTLTLTNNDESDPIAVPAGSAFTTPTGLRFTSDVAVTVPGFRRVGGQDKPGVITVAVTAAAIGENYNVGPQSVVSNNIEIDAAFETATAGGSKRQVTVVTDEDVAKAKEKLAAQDAEAVKQELRQQFGDSAIVITESFVASASQPASNPAVGQEATAAKLTAETKYSLFGLSRADLSRILEADITSQLEGAPNQKVYDSGINAVSFSGFASAADGAYAVTVSATGYAGPSIDSDEVAEKAAGRRAGEVQADIQAIEGVDSVDVQLSPFWVTKVPSKDKITVKFIVNNESR